MSETQPNIANSSHNWREELKLSFWGAGAVLVTTSTLGASLPVIFGAAVASVPAFFAGIKIIRYQPK